MRRFLIAITALLCLIVLAPFAVLAIMQTNAGRNFVERKIAEVLTVEGRSVKLGEPRIDWDGTIHAASLVVGDANGTWFSARGIRATWSPLALLGGRLSIGSVRVDEIDVARQPEGLGTAEPKPAPAEEEKGGGLPLDIDIPQIRLREIRLAAPVAGTPIRLSARASVRLRAEPAIIEAAVHVERDDDVSGRFDAALGYVQDAPFLRVDMRASEPQGGLIARLLSIDALPAVDASLSGEGRLDAWHGNLSVALNQRETVKGKLDLTRAAQNRQLVLALDGALADILPPGMRDVFAGSLHVKGTADLAADYTPLGGNLDMTSDALSLNAAGDFDRESGRLSARLDAALSRPASWGEDAAKLSADALKISAKATGTLSDADWQATIAGTGLRTAEGRLDDLSLQASGDNADLRTQSLNVPIDMTGQADLAAVTPPRLEPFLGPLRLAATGRLGAEGTFEFNKLDMRTAVASANLAGTYAPREANLAGDVSVPDLKVLSALAGRPLGGSLSAHVTAEGDPAARSGSLTIDAKGRDLDAGEDRLTALLAGEATLSGTFSRNEDGALEASDLVLSSPGVNAQVSGQSDLDAVSGNVSLTIADLKPLDERISGALDLEASLSGTLSAPELEARLESENLTMQGEPVEGLVATVTGSAPDGRPEGQAQLDATFRGQPLAASAALASDEDGTRRLKDITVEAASTRLEDHLALDAAGQPSGVIDLDAPDLTEIAPLLLQELAGAVTAHVEIPDTQDGARTAHVTARAENLKRANLTIAAADLDATITDPLATPRIEGTATVRDIRQGGLAIGNVNARASHDGEITDFSAKADLAEGKLSVDGNIKPEGDGFAIALAKAGGSWKGIQTKLNREARIVVQNGTAQLHDVVLALGEGTASLSGSAGTELDLDLRLDAVPMSIANALAPGQGIRGSVSGTAHAGGAASNPEANWTLTWSGASAAQIASYGLPDMTIKSEGGLKNNKLTQTTVASLGEGTVTAKGSVNLAASPAGLDMQVNGRLPLSLAQRQLLNAGLRLEGTADVDMTIGGNIAAPSYGGTISGSNLTAVGLDTGVTIKSLNVNARFSADALEVTELSGELGGGRLSGRGRLGLGPDLPADFTVKIDDATYQDGAVVKARFDADMAFKGPLAGSPTLSGTVLLKRTDITIPETVGGKISALSVKHVNAPADVRRQTETLDKGEGDGNSGGGAIQLDLTVRAPGQMFVRGRGLQAELSGTVRIQGTTASPVTSGGFTLRRGTLGVLSRQLTFTQGSISFLGSFDPRLDFAATTSTSEAEVTVSVSGNASDPKITFSSSPDMPQDEILAQLLFGQSLSNLSATQIAQLASAVATLGGNDPLDRLRQSLGVDSINLTTDEENNTAVNLGKNLGDKLRLGVQQGTASSSSRVTIDLDINKTLRARGEVGEDGDSKAGIYFEKEY